MKVKESTLNKLKPQMKWIGAPALAAAVFLGLPNDDAAGAELGSKLLYEGKDHVHVEELQSMLNENNLLKDKHITGTYDAKTTQAVTTYQEKNGLIVDGLAGVQTISSLSILEQGDEGATVSSLQEDLNTLGFYEYKIDGIFGPITHQAVVDFQKSQGITVDGLAGPETFSALHEAVNGSDASTVGTATVEETTVAVAEEPVEEEAPAEEPVEEEAPAEEPVEEEAPAEEPVEEEAPAEEPAEEEAPAEEPAEEEAPAEEPAEEEAPAEEPAEEEAPAEEPAEEEAPAEEPVEEEAPAEEPVEEEAPAEEPAEETPTATEEPAAETPVEEDTADVSEAEGQTMTMEATAYTANCAGCTGVTATGIDLNANPNQSVVAVDPNVIPLGSTVYVEGYGEAVAGDTGGNIQGNRIDLYMQERGDAVNFGRQNVQVTVID
ncbi:peptidoglycan-binding protein [Bacillus sp. FJAT-44742]|uniref:peptidoglycan-binding protein n=1 Tax=Bacillus sp. FJAT-44742 TaxID=2014005 RepID=UPI000C23733C|nr:peptidoglycan-binding protein [Bacillus sp. FJAT-44742]